ncbi:MAG: hypothetical protein PUP93_07065 [Rhizonema sp. NSF051]|nr:hypothetical protein [Rhizonema sp. NSF051]
MLIHWAYNNSGDMAVPEAKIFRLHWRTREDKTSAQKPYKGEFMLLLQRAKVTHIVEFLEDEVYESTGKVWNVYRIVKAVWMPPNACDWYHLPHQREFFGYDEVVADGLAHSLSEADKMWKFHEYWDKRGGLSVFQKHVADLLTKISKSGSI